MKKYFRWIQGVLFKTESYIRFFYLSLLFEEIGKGTKFYGRLAVYYPQNIRIGKNCTFNEGVILNGRAPITIGDNVRISPQAIIETGYLNMQDTALSKPHLSKEIVIEDNVWIASGARILAGVRIERDSVVAAGAVVTKDISKNSIAKGVPAKVQER